MKKLPGGMMTTFLASARDYESSGTLIGNLKSDIFTIKNLFPNK